MINVSEATRAPSQPPLPLVNLRPSKEPRRIG
jgi:hypothetical protein